MHFGSQIAALQVQIIDLGAANVDIWRRLQAAVERRGGLRQNGPRKLWIRWQRAHLRADIRESAEQKYMRRWNDAADSFANEGRKLHESVTRTRARTDFLHEVAN